MSLSDGITALHRRIAELTDERDEARAEVVRLGKALELAEDDAVRLDDLLGDARQQAIRDAKELDCWRQAFGDTALKDATARLRAALDEERIEPQVCPAHGAHPHNGRRCLDCPTCAEGEAG